MSLVLFPLLWLSAFAFRHIAEGIDPASMEARYLFVGYISFVYLLVFIYSAAASSIFIHGALRTVRGKTFEFFSGAEHTGGMCGLLLLQGLGSLVYAGLIVLVGYFTSGNPIVSLIIILPTGIIFAIFILMQCFSPVAVIDGFGPIEAMARSIRICRNYPMSILYIFVFTLLYTVSIVVTLGLALLVVGLPNQAYAAAYHLGNKKTPLS